MEGWNIPSIFSKKKEKGDTMAKKQKPQVDEIVEMNEAIDEKTLQMGIIIICDKNKGHVIVSTEKGNVPVEKEKLAGQNLKIGEVVYF